MNPRYWLELRGAFKWMIFVGALSLLAVYWSSLPGELREVMFKKQRGLGSLPVLMICGWCGGWFTLLFVRAQDLNVVSPFPFDQLNRVLAGMLIAASVLIGITISMTFEVSR
jgi:hypothetical protein